MGGSERAELRGQVLDGKYRVGASIGVGGTGVVFETERLSDGAPLVMKVLRPLYAYNADLARRLRREAEVAREVGHPGIVPVLDEGQLEDGSPYVVMERVWGESMARLIRRSGTLGAGETAVIAARAAAILHAVHRQGYVHRDVKPEHILLDRASDGSLVVHLLDFGVCASESASVEERERERARVFGTPSYVSPEQASGDPYVDGRADVFGLGVCMFEALAGRVPFTGSGVMNVLRRIIREDAPRVGLLAMHVDATLDGVVTRALSRSREERFPNMRALARALVPLLRQRQEVERQLAASLCVGEELPETLATHRDEAA
ncbi:MAG: serine/threonine-protein kinase [Myxococcota bacterium]